MIETCVRSELFPEYANWREHVARGQGGIMTQDPPAGECFYPLGYIPSRQFYIFHVYARTIHILYLDVVKIHRQSELTDIEI